MKFDKESVENLDAKLERKILLKGRLVFNIISFIFVILGLISLMGGAGEAGLVIFIPALVLLILGIKNLFLKGEKRERYLTSKLVATAIKEEKKNGKALSKEEIEKIKFEYDPIFHDKIISRVHKVQDKKYANNVKIAENNVKKLIKERINEINRINKKRWQSVGNGNLMYNLVEGKININKTIHLFSSIKGAEVNKEDSYRVVTTENGKSKKHASLGGAVAGGLLFGAVGAIVGGTALGKTTSKGESISNSIPTCNHIGVIVDIDGFKSEVILLNHTVNQSSLVYKIALQEAQEIVSKLHFLATQPVPKTFTKVEDEQSVLDIGKSIAEAQKELERVKANKPTYEIPEKYLNNFCECFTKNAV